MRHCMKLRPAPFSMIRSGRKTFELRLNDEKRKLICIGDEILFECTEGDTAPLLCRVVGLHPFDSFETLYRTLPLLSCGYTEETVATADPRDMEAYYSADEIRQHGVLAIALETLAAQ